MNGNNPYTLHCPVLNLLIPWPLGQGALEV